MNIYEFFLFLEDHLAPCPFCNSVRGRLEYRQGSYKNNYIDFYLVKCPSCKAQGPIINVSNDCTGSERVKAAIEAMERWGSKYTTKELIAWRKRHEQLSTNHK